MKLIKLLFSAI